MSEDSEREQRIHEHEDELLRAKDTLGDLQVVVHFREVAEMEAVVVRLIQHDHHFAVLTEMDLALVVSASGLDSLYKMQEEMR